MSRGMVYYGLPGRAPSCALLAALLTLAGAMLPGLGAVPPDPAGWQILFQDDFEHGDGAWTLWTPPDPTATGEWKLVQEGGNWVFAGSDHAFARATGGSWGDMHLHLRAKVNGGSFHL